MNKLNKLITTSLLGFTSIGYLAYESTNENKERKPQEAAKIQYKKRTDHLKEILAQPEYDVVVVGGGCNGVGVLLDSSTRGLKTLLIEKDDFASGASSKSTKLIHGGVRYLQQVFELSLDSISSRI
jgi:heterodisulfide reductase subunit A-like polyferredoxin